MSNPRKLAAGNTLTLRGGRWVLADTDEAGMHAALREIESAGVRPGATVVFGRGGVAPAVTRALEAHGWLPVKEVSARQGWRGDGQPVTLVVNAAGPAVAAAAGAPESLAWLDLHYRDIACTPAHVQVYRNGRTFFDAQGMAQRAIWNEQKEFELRETERLLECFPVESREYGRTPLHQLLRNFPLRQFPVTVGDRTITITTAEDIDQLINNITDEEFDKDERLPYWAELWHSAVAVAEYIAANPELVSNLDVLEVGCGLGVPGIIASLAGAHITFSDNDPTALLAAHVNHCCNASASKAEFALLDFRSPPAHRWPVIIAADVLYEKRYLEPFADFLSRTLAPGGVALIAEPNRLVAESFFDAIKTMDFHMERHGQQAWLYGRFVDVSIYLLKKLTITDGKTG